MKPKLTGILALIVILPLAVSGWLGVKVARDEQLVVQHRIRELMLSQLRAVRGDVARAVADHARAVVDEMQPLTTDARVLRERVRSSPRVRQHFVVTGNGRFVHPPVGTPDALTTDEREALARTRRIWDRGELLDREEEPSATGEAPIVRLDGARVHWHGWYRDSGLQWMLWLRDGERIHAAELDRVRMLADVVAALPDTDRSDPQIDANRIRLVDARGSTLYQWGSFEPPGDATPAAEIALEAPLNAWTLEYLAPASVFGAAVAGGVLLNLVAGLVLIGGVMLALAYYFYREQTREIREAAERVSFVNQVSHELKTPLTNIRMYAELLEHDIDEDPAARRHLDVVVSESRRLSRLIGNILTFSRKQRGGLRISRSRAVADDVVDDVLEQFAPALEASGVAVERIAAAPEAVGLDRDALEQILGNLIGNVEKYGAAGGILRVATHRQGSRIEITVTDAGPGIPARERERIFRPFYRVRSELTEGVSGTGIGLALARELAGLHGGDLVLLPSDRGAVFRVTLDCPNQEANG